MSEHPIPDTPASEEGGSAREPSGEPASRLRWLAWPTVITWAATLALPAILLRGHAVFDLGTAAGDLRGFVSDLLVAMGIAGVGVPIGARLRGLRARTGWGITFLVSWTLLLVANDAHVRALGAPVTPDHGAYLVDPTFFLGSALPTLLAPKTLGLLFLVAAAALGLARRGPGASEPRKGLATLEPLGWTLASVVVLGLWTPDPTASDWRRAHVVEHNVRLLLAGPSPGGSDPGDSSPTSSEGDLPWNRADLGGEPLVPTAAGRNVILVLIEGASNGHLPTPAARQGFAAPPFLPRFDRALVELASSGPRVLFFEHLLQPQRQTNRGEYALLCGRPPKLLGGEPKMSEAVREGTPEHLDCLPAALADAGWRTVYFQASPLSFMLKDQFMPKAGFQRILGDESILEARRRNEWGVDDATFLEHSRRLITELDAAEEPYFLTLLTVGTHHPYNAPPEHASAFPTGSLPWAFSYLDEALASFVHWLGESGVLDDTLVLFLSDESAGFGRAPDAIADLLAQAWGLGVALVPADGAPAAASDGAPIFVDQAFLQTDLPLSILDHLGLASGGPGRTTGSFGGRSLFRLYPEDAGRSLALGNVYLRRVGLLEPGGVLTTCDTTLDGCSAWQLDADRLFSFRRRPADMQPRALHELERLARASQRTTWSTTGGSTTETARYPLIRESRVALLPTGYRQWIFAGQFFTFPAGSEVEVRIRVSAEGEAETGGPPGTDREARTWLIHDLFGPEGEKLYEQGVELAAGQGVEFAYRLEVGTQELDRVESRLWTARYQGRDVGLRIHRAELVVHRPEDGSEADGAPRIVDEGPSFFGPDNLGPDNLEPGSPGAEP